MTAHEERQADARALRDIAWALGRLADRPPLVQQAPTEPRGNRAPDWVTVMVVALLSFAIGAWCAVGAQALH